VAKLADAEPPLQTFKPAGLEVILPPLPATATVIVALEVAHAEPHVSVPPQPSGVVPQVLPCAAQVVGVRVALAVTFSGAVTVLLRVADTVAATLACTGVVLAVKLAVFAPDGKAIEVGTLTKLLLRARVRNYQSGARESQMRATIRSQRFWGPAGDLCLRR
jgi:hypothetical protein